MTKDMAIFIGPTTPSLNANALLDKLDEELK